MTTVLDVTQTQTATPEAGVVAATATGRLAPLFAGIWLFFLLNPLLEGWARRDEVRGVLGMVTTLLFAGVYMTLWLRARADRQRMVATPSLGWSLTYVGALVVLGLVTLACVGEPGLSCASDIAWPLALSRRRVRPL